MRHLSSEEVSVFTYEDWLSRTRGPRRTVDCEMAAVVDEEVMVELTTYIIQVKTSDNAGRPAAQLHFAFVCLWLRTQVRKHRRGPRVDPALQKLVTHLCVALVHTRRGSRP